MKLRRKKPKHMQFILGWCDCGAPMALDDANRRADCADILRGSAIPKGEPGSLRHSDVLPYAFYKLRKAVPNVEVRREPRNQPALDPEEPTP